MEAGGTWILAGSGPAAAEAAGHYDFQYAYLPVVETVLAAQTPLLNGPALLAPPRARAITYLVSKRTDFIVHLAVDSGPVLVTFNQGKGRVILTTLTEPFTNAGLKEPANQALVRNLIGLAGQAQGQAWFDERRHYPELAAEEIIGPQQWLMRTPEGNAILYLALVIFIALILQGRSFGKPVRLPEEIHRRGPIETIAALANLNRRAGHRRAVLQQYRQRLKRQIGRRYRLDATLPDGEWVDQLAKLRPDIDAGQLAGLLARLNRPKPNEEQVVQLAQEAADWTEKNL